MSDESNTLDLTNVPDNDVEEEQVEEEEEESGEEEEQEEQEEQEEEEEEGEEEQAEEEEEEQAEEEEEQEEEEQEEEGQEEEEETVEDVEQSEEEEQEEQSVEETVEETVEDVQEEEQAEQPVAPLVTDNLCSLKTLVDVLGKWSAGEIKRWKIEDLLKEGSEVDENLDDLEKVVEIFQLLFKSGRPRFAFRNNNHLLQFDEYTFSGESRNLSEEKKVEILKTLTKLVVNISENNTSNEDRINILNNIY